MSRAAGGALCALIAMLATSEVQAQTDLPTIWLGFDGPSIVEEGGKIKFKIHRDKASASPLEGIAVYINQIEGDGSYIKLKDIGYSCPGYENFTPDRCFTIPAGKDSITVEIPTYASTSFESDATIHFGIRGGHEQYNFRRHYRYSSPAIVTATVRDGPDSAPVKPEITVTLGVHGTSASEGNKSERVVLGLTLTRPLRAGESLRLPLVFAGGQPGSDFRLQVFGPPSGVTFDAGTSTVTFTGSGTSSSNVFFDLIALDDADADDETVIVAVPKPVASGIPGWVEVKRTGKGRILLVDDDEAPLGSGQPATPQVTVAADAASVSEGAAASFTILANPHPAAALTVNLSVVAQGDFGVKTGSRTVTIPTTGSATLGLPTTNDATAEPNGSVSVTAGAGTGYTVGSPSSASVAVTDKTVVPLCAASSAGTAGVTIAISEFARAFELDDLQIMVAETGAFGDTYTVALDSRPTHDVVITASSSLMPLPEHLPKPMEPPGEAVELRGEGASAYGAKTTLRFTPLNWCVPQKVDVRGIDDDIHNSPLGDRRAIVAHEATSSDGNYGGIDIDSLEVQAIDNEPAWELTPKLSSTSVAEGGTLEITFTMHPVRKLWNTTVEFTLSPTSGASNPAEDADLPQPLERTVFIPANTATVKTSIAFPDDSLDEGDEQFTITFKRAGLDYAQPRPPHPLGWIIVDLTIIDDDGADPLPEVTIAADAASTTEGADASFTITADPAPASALPVSLTVAASGDYGVTAGSRTVTIPTTGSVTLTLPTAGDTTDEADGSVTVTVDAGDGYTVGTASSGTVSILDDDDPPLPEVTIAADAASKTEGADASFTLTASPAPASPLAVSVSVAAQGDYGVTAGSRTVTIPTTGSATLTLPTTDDNADETDGSVTVTLASGDGYTVGSASSGTISILDDDDPPLPEVTIAADAASKTEGADASFTITASPAPTAALAVSVSVAAQGDYGVTAGSRTVTVPATGSATLTLPTTDDNADETDGSVTVTLASGNGYTVGSASSGTISILDDDDPPLPEVTIAADAASKTEGAAASFTITADPAPASALAVSVSVAAQGDYGITAGSRTVTIPTTGSAKLTLPTTGDTADEPDGSITATLEAGNGYTVGSASSGTISILDDDEAAPLPPGVDPDLVSDIRGYLAETHNPNTGLARPAIYFERWKRALEGLGVEDYAGLAPMTAAEAQGYADRSWPRWVPVAAALEALEQAAQPPETPVQVPAVTVAADAASATEGAAATFTVTASPAPASPLAVSVSVAAAGDYGVTAGSRTVTVPATGSATLSIGTAGDTTDEADGSVTVTVDAGNGYTVGTASSGTVSILDDDEPPLPEVTIAADAASATEGGAASFTITASPAPSSPLAVSVSVATNGDFGVTAGSRTVTVPATGSATLSIATAGDTTDEPDGAVTVTVDAGNGYTVGSAASGTVSILDDDVPAISIAAVAGSVTEGGAASFTVTASPAPASPLAVSVGVATNGDFGVAAGSRTVTVPTTGSATLTLATTDDAADEPDGSVTATVNAGDGYTVGSAASGTVSILDDDEPPPEVTIAADAAAIAEGGNAAFTVTADRAPAADLAVKLSVSEAAGSDMVAAAHEGPATVVIPKGGTTAAFTVPTVDDAADEPDGTVTATLAAGAGYTLGAAASATVAVADNDAAGLALSIDDATAREGERMRFTVRLSAPSRRLVGVRLWVQESTPVSARAGVDYQVAYHTVVLSPGQTIGHAEYYIYDDSHDDGGETFEVLIDHVRAFEPFTVADGVAVGTIENADPLPAAYLARFGRTVAEQALDGIAGRMAADRTPGMQGSIAGQALSFDPAASDQSAAGQSVASATIGGATPGASGTSPANREAVLAMADIAQGLGASSPAGPVGAADPFGDNRFGNGAGFGTPSLQSRTMTARDALLGSSFSLTGQKDGAGGSLAFWGRASQGRFDGAERGDGTDIAIDGEVTTGMLGADYARGKWLVGLALTQSTADGGYAAMGGGDPVCPEVDGEVPVLCDGAVRAGDGEVEASLTAAIPYAALQVSERLKLWGAAGYGSGEVTLKTMDESYSADTSWTMAAAGLRSELLAPPEVGSSGPALALTSDALWAETASEKTRDLAASDSSVTRLRLGLEGSYRMALEDDGHLTPKLEIGARHDGGDAETGFGVEIGGGIAWVDPGLGLSLDLSGRTLVSHENDDLKDQGFSAALGFDPAPATQRGPSLSLRQEFGGQASGGLDALFAPEALEDRTGSEAASRWAMEAAYGFPAFGGRFTGSPHVGFGLATGARDYSVGWRLKPEAATAPDLSFGLRATRRESDTADPEHTVGIELTARW